jgi:NAD-dependent dihydropyrimidine dehydrogenase PreA subunit
MSVKITEECIGCGSCEPACPFGAIKIEQGAAVINEACTQCGACTESCPVGAIIREEEAKQEVVDKSQYQDVWVFMEVTNGSLRNVGLELLGEGSKLAKTMGQKLAGVLIGENVADMAKDIFAAGADKVYLVEAPELASYNTDGYAATFVDLIKPIVRRSSCSGPPIMAVILARASPAASAPDLPPTAPDWELTNLPVMWPGPARLLAATLWLPFCVLMTGRKWALSARRCSRNLCPTMQTAAKLSG